MTNVPPSYRHQSTDLHCRSIDWFLYDGERWTLMFKRIINSQKRVYFTELLEDLREVCQ